MTIFLRALWGPFSPGANMLGTELRWHFFGVREDYSMGRWELMFDLEKRRFGIITHQMPEKPTLPGFADAFVPDGPMLYGRTYTDILKARLPPAELARATATALQRRRR